MEWLVLGVVIVAMVANKLSRLKTLRLQWGLLHLEFDVTPTPPRQLKPPTRPRRIKD